MPPGGARLELAPQSRLRPYLSASGATTTIAEIDPDRAARCGVLRQPGVRSPMIRMHVERASHLASTTLPNSSESGHRRYAEPCGHGARGPRRNDLAPSSGEAAADEVPASRRSARPADSRRRLATDCRHAALEPRVPADRNPGACGATLGASGCTTMERPDSPGFRRPRRCLSQVSFLRHDREVLRPRVPWAHIAERAVRAAAWNAICAHHSASTITRSPARGERSFAIVTAPASRICRNVMQRGSLRAVGLPSSAKFNQGRRAAPSLLSDRACRSPR